MVDSQLPAALRARPQWALAGPEKAPYSLVNNKLMRVGPTNIDTLLTYDRCIELLKTHQNMLGFGYVLTQDDGFVCIDLDIKDSHSTDKDGAHYPPHQWTTPGDITRFNKILERFRSYTEVSLSGKGCHIWLKGTVPTGARRAGIEIYSDARFIVCTGKAIRTGRYKYDTKEDLVILQKYPGAPYVINELHMLLEELYGEVSGSAYKDVETASEPVADGEEVFTDPTIVRLAMAAENGEKFDLLCNGQWEHVGYPSQSEADAALLSILAFYSPSNAQCKRLFRLSKLGRREKSSKNDVYLDRTLAMVRKKNFDQKEIMEHVAVQDVQEITEEEATFAPSSEFNYDSILQYPPGFTGEVARYIYNSSMRPVKEIAITGALGMIAGLCGKAFPINDESGTNLYITLVARSAIGKEAMYSGIARILDACKQRHPLITQFYNSNDYASGQALLRAVSDRNCFLHMNSEWGRQLRRMANEQNSDGPMQKLRTVMTTLHSKSGPVGVTGGLQYSDSDKNTSAVSGVAYSIIGETTPGVYYDSLDSTMMEDGFLSRFIVIEYAGGRVATNRKRIVAVPELIVDTLGELCTRSVNLITSMRHEHISLSPTVEDMANEFDQFCDTKINEAGDNESFRQLWNRGHLHSLRVAGLLAVADNNVTPVVEKQHYEWARSLILHHAGMMIRKFAEGKVGSSDDTRMVKLISILQKYIAKRPTGVNELLWSNGIITRRYLHNRLRSNIAFTKHRLGMSFALEATVRSLCDNGYMHEVPKHTALGEYQTSQKLYKVIVK